MSCPDRVGANVFITPSSEKKLSIGRESNPQKSPNNAEEVTQFCVRLRLLWAHLFPASPKSGANPDYRRLRELLPSRGNEGRKRLVNKMSGQSTSFHCQ